MFRNMFYKYCHGYQELPEDRIPLRTFERTVTTQPAGYQPASNRWYPQTAPVVPALQSPAPGGEVAIFAKNLTSAPASAPHRLPTTGGMMCYSPQGTCLSSLQYTSPAQYYYHQSTIIAAGFSEQGRVIANPLTPQQFPLNSSLKQFYPNTAAQQFYPNTATQQFYPNTATQQFYPNTATQQFYPNTATQQFYPNTATQQFYPNTATQQFSNPYFEMNNLRNQLSGHGAGNPFLTSNHFISQRSGSSHFISQQFTGAAWQDVFNGDEKKEESSTRLQLEGAMFQVSPLPQGARTARSRDKATSTSLVLGARKRRQKPEKAANRPEKAANKAPNRRLVEHEAAPGAERHNTLNPVMEIKVKNSEEFILDSMRESPESEQVEEATVDEATVERVAEAERVAEEVKTVEAERVAEEVKTAEAERTAEAEPPTSLEVVPSPVVGLVRSPIQTTCIEDILMEVGSTEDSPSSPADSLPQSPVTPATQSPMTPATQSPMTPATPLTPGSIGFEWCEEYEYELVEEELVEEGEGEEALELEFNFELDSPSREDSPARQPL